MDDQSMKPPLDVSWVLAQSAAPSARGGGSTPPLVDLEAMAGGLNGTVVLVLLLILLAGVLAVSYRLGRKVALDYIGAGEEVHSTPDYYGWFAMMWALTPSIVLTALFLVLDAAGSDRLRPAGWFNPGYGAYAMVWAVFPPVAGLLSLSLINPKLRARHHVERFIYTVLFSAAMVSILTTVGVFLSVLWESLAFFRQVSPIEFFFGTEWNPGGAFRESAGREGDGGGSFGALPLFLGTLVITGLAMLVAVPIGLLSAVFLSEYAGKNVRRMGKPVLEVLAGIPTVVYGFFAAVTVGPLLSRVLTPVLGPPVLDDMPSAQMALVPGIIMGVMIIPFMSSLCDDVINAVPNSLRQGSLAMGATRSETVKKVILPAALPGIISAFLLAISRAVGETMIVVMAAGAGTDQDAAPSLNPVEIVQYPFEMLTTVTVQIVANLTGDLAYDNPQTLSAFSLGLALLVMTLVLNVISAVVIRRFRKRYEQV